MTRFARRLLGATLLAGALPLALPTLALQSEEYGPSSLSGTYLAARTADAGKDTANAAAFYRSARTADPDNLFLLERAVVLTAASGDVGEALGFARELAEKAPTNHVARLLLAVDHIRTGKYDDAVTALDRTGAGVIGDLTSTLLRAWATFGRGDAEKALTDLEELDGEEWYEPFRLLHGGYIALAAGRSEEAIDDFTKARELDSNAVRITEAYARTIAVAGRTKEAEEALQEFLGRFPDNALASATLEEVRSGNAARGLVSDPATGAAEALAGIGAAVGQEGGVEVASLYLRLALYLEPQTAGGLAALSLGNLLDGNGQGETAIQIFESIGAGQPFRGLGVLRAALSLDRMDRTKEAEQAFKEAIRRNPEDLQTYISYGNMLRGRERYDESAEIYTQAIARIPELARNDWSLLYFRGIAHERTKKWAEAEADFKRALKLYPDQPLVLNYLGYSWVDMGQNLTEALEMIRKAVELRPNDGYIVDSLGWAYYRLGRYDEAVTELERAVSLRSDDPVINDHLGDAYWKTGRTLEAQFQWRHARDFGAKDEDLERILKKIAERRLIEVEKDAAMNTEPG